MSCIEIRPLLSLRLLDVLEDDEASAVEAHLEACPVCRSLARSRDELFSSLQEAPGAHEAPPAELWDRIAKGLDAAPAPLVPAPVAAELSIALSCSFCHDVLARTEATYCASCLAPHHGDCFRTHGRCSALGCEETLTLRTTLDGALAPAPRRAARRGLGLAATAIVLAVAGGVAALVGRTPPPRQPRPDEIDVSVEAADLRDVVERIARISGHNVVVDPGVDEKITIDLHGISWRDALDVIARMSRCEIEERGPVLVFVQPARVTIQYTDANVRTVLQLIAAYSGRNVIVTPDVQGEVTLDFKGVRYLDALEVVAKARDLYVYEKQDVFLVSAHPTDWGRVVVEARPSPGGAAPLESRATPAPAAVAVVPSETAPGAVAASPEASRMSASRMPAGTWFQLLAEAARKNLVLSDELKAGVDADVKGVGPEEALDSTARDNGFTVVREKDNVIRLVRARDAAAPTPGGEPPHTEVMLPSGEPLVLTLEGVIFLKTPGRPNKAVVNGKIYEEGDRLLDAHDTPLPAWITVTRVGEGLVELEIGKKGPRLVLKVGR